MTEPLTRKGRQTSEFWLVVSFFAVVLLNGTDLFTIPSEQIVLLATLAFGYGGGRTLLKNAIARTGAPA